MPLNSFKIIEKKQLTKDVYEITVEANEKFDFLPGQFITFILP
jgi:NAD(P)H-flavin reductase